jgi:crotonobetainyl-CoA:carnitine CoA-transferase CaiB-like acyl-CoA transferase
MTATSSTALVPGALTGLVVVELGDARTAFAGKLMADLGADVIVVEPPGGSPTRRLAPFVDGQDGPEYSLWWWHYNTSKRSIVIDTESDADTAQLRELIATADIVLDGTAYVSGPKAADRDELRAQFPRLIWTHITPYGASVPYDLDTDLTILAESGPVWNCGYDDHSLPPVRGGGGQAAQIAGTFAAISTLAAVVRREITGTGQVVDVSMLAAGNITSESGTFNYFVNGGVVQRQTGRHAAVQPTLEVQVLAADGRYVTTGFLPTSKETLGKLLDWLEERGLTEEFPQRAFLQMGFDQGGVDRSRMEEPEAMLIMESSREALRLIAARSTAYEFFLGSQQRGFQCGVIYSPEQAYEDPHFKARGYQQTVHHPAVGRDVRHPGAPYLFSDTPWRLSRAAPMIDQDGDEIRAALAEGPGND